MNRIVFKIKIIVVLKYINITANYSDLHLRNHFGACYASFGTTEVPKRYGNIVASSGTFALKIHFTVRKRFCGILFFNDIQRKSFKIMAISSLATFVLTMKSCTLRNWFEDWFNQTGSTKLIMFNFVEHKCLKNMVISSSDILH